MPGRGTSAFSNLAARSAFLGSVNRHQHALHALPRPHEFSSSFPGLSTLPTLLTSVQVFDGSEISNAVVVSNSFWSTLSSKLPYLILGQLLASITFVVIASVVTAQGKFVVDKVSSKINDDTQKNLKSSQFRRADEPQLPTLDFTKLFLCICIDFVGSANEAIPLVGELVDIVYAPMAALLLRQLFAGSNIVFLLEFTEEILPFTDILPLATICWVVESFFGGGNLARALRIGEFASYKVDTGDFVDVGGTTVRENAGSGDRPNLLPQSEEIVRDNAKR